MNKEFIERLVELAEGFLIFNEVYILFKTDSKAYFPIVCIEQSIIYPTLLSRAAEGWNRKEIENNTGSAFWVSPDNIFTIKHNNKTVTKYIKDYKPTEYLTPQEQALEAVLMEVLK